MPRSDYRFAEIHNGFRIEHPRRAAVDIQLIPWTLKVSGGQGDPARIGLPQRRSLTQAVAQRLFALPNIAPTNDTQILRESMAIGSELHRRLDLLLADVDRDILAVQERSLAFTSRVVPLAEDPALYRHLHLVSDILRYEPAAIAFTHYDSELWPHFLKTRLLSPEDRGHQRSDWEWAALVPPVGDSFPAEAVVANLCNWRGLFSPDGMSYRSLDRTLMNLPPGIPPKLLCQLRCVRLERPIRSRVKLLALLVCLAHRIQLLAPGHGSPMLQRSTQAEIRRALKHIGDATQRSLREDSEDDLVFALKYLADYPEPHFGRLGGLADKAIRWHRDAPLREAEQTIAALGGPEQATELPPIPLPDDPGITFLDTVGALLHEGRRMSHCIASRARAAVAGECFLFHIEYGGEQASAEVGRNGELRDCVGPWNGYNIAADWAHQKLSAWAAALPRGESSTTCSLPDDVFRAIAAGYDLARWIGDTGRLATATVPPPITPPNTEDVVFLGSVRDIIEHGRWMKHPLTAYAEDAIQGRLFFFHINHGGEDATVAVTGELKVYFSLGPGTTVNGAARWGAAELARWVRGEAADDTPDESVTGQLVLPFTTQVRRRGSGIKDPSI